MKIKKLTNEMPETDREKFVNEFYESEIKKSATLSAIYKKDGLDTFLIERKIDWFERNLLT